ncbi:MAG: HEAT repeat domain-containing protein [Gemmataceae bacterium]
MRHSTLSLVLLASLALPAVCYALGEESFGNAPKIAQKEWADGVIHVVNLKSRVYAQWVNGNENMYYRGDVAAVNEALKAFASIKDDDLRVVLLPGAGGTHSFDRKPIAYDWQLHVPSGIYRSMTKKTHPVLTIYVPTMNPKPIADRKAVDRWIQELDHNDFAVREDAQKQLQKVGRDLKPILQQSLKGDVTAEQRTRLTKLLNSFKEFDASDLVIPKGVTVQVAENLLADCKKELSSSNQNVSWMAVDRIATLSDLSPGAIPELIQSLAVGKPDHVRMAAAEKLGSMGKKAQSALATLKKVQEDSDPKIRQAMKQACDQIEAAKETETTKEAENLTKTIVKELEQVQKMHAGK